MNEVLRDFEQVALRFSPQVLVPAGIAMLAGGLCVWLGGLRWARLIAGALGAAIGAMLALCLTDGQSVAIGLMSVLGAGFGSFFHRATVVLTGAVLVGLLAAAILVGPRLAAPDPWSWPGSARAGQEELNPNETLFVLGDQAQYAAARFVRAMTQTSPLHRAVPVVAGLLLAVASIWLVRFAGALSCSVLGTGLMAAGMVSVLLYKGARPLSSACQNVTFYGIVGAGMVAFGAAISLLLCPARRPAAPKQRQEGE